MSGSDIGTTIAFAAGVPAAFTEAGYEAMTWANVVGLVSVGEVGDDHETISVPDLTAGRVRSLKGAATGSVVPIALRGELPGEVITGRNSVEAAAKSNVHAENSLRITDGAGNEDYISGVFMSWKRNERTTSSYEGFSFVVTVNYPVVSGT